MTELAHARNKLASGELAEVRKLLAQVSRKPSSEEQFASLMVLVQAELLSNTRLEAARTLAVARRVARDLERPDLEREVGFRGVEAALLGDVTPARELDRLRAQVTDPDELAWLNALEALSLARDGKESQASERLEQAQAVARSGGMSAIRVLPWIVRAELALSRPERAKAAARAGEWIAAGLGLVAHQQQLARLAAAAEGASSPEAQQAVLGLVDLASATAGARDLKPLLEQVGRATMELLDVDRTFVVLKGRDQNMRVAAGIGRQGAPSGSPSRSIVDRAMRTGLPVVSNDLDRDGSARSASIVSMGLRSVICAPMLQGADALGVIYGDSERVTEHELKRVEWLARGLAGVAAVAVANAQRLDAAERRSHEAREIAHDVRNLLGSVLLSTEDIGEADDVPSWARGLSMRTRGATVQMQEHLDRLLSRRPPRREKVRVDRQVLELSKLLDRVARESKVRLAVEVHPVELAVAADELGRAFTNLLSNAIKYAPPESTVAVKVDVSPTMVRISVRDEGPGIPETELERIFTSGVQARGAAKGHGLGLGIAARVARDHGGRIWAENQPSGGARFVMELPRS